MFGFQAEEVVGAIRDVLRGRVYVSERNTEGKALVYQWPGSSPHRWRREPMARRSSLMAVVGGGTERGRRQDAPAG